MAISVQATERPPAEGDADAIAVGLLDGERPAPAAGGAVLAPLLDSGEARTGLGDVALAHDGDGRRWLGVGLGERADLDPERARRAAAAAERRAREISARRLCWALPAAADGPGAEALAGALVEGTLLSAHRFERFKTAAGGGRDGLEALTVSGGGELAGAVERARLLAEAQNAARDLQDEPGNELTPAALAGRALQLAAELDGVTVEIAGREQIEARGMGAFAAVARGSRQEPRLIVARYEGPAARGPLLGYVGKAVTFDSGGISLKPGAKMHEMKFDMSGGAAVLQAIAALAALRAPVRVLGVIGATENLPGGAAVKPGDIVRALNGTTIEVNNTDAEGRLVLADCLAHAVRLGAQRLVDVATLTGAIVVALGSTHAGLMADDDDWAQRVQRAAGETGELVWRLPLHEEYGRMIEGRYADIVNTTAERKASSITAAHFLRRFTGDVPWAHLDIAGVAWDSGRPYAERGGSGFGVRLLAALAEAEAASASASA